MKKSLKRVIGFAITLLLLGGCSEKGDIEDALMDKKIALEVVINDLESDELLSREAIGAVNDQIALVETQLDEVQGALDALKSQEILIMEDTGSAIADINEFPTARTDGNESVIQGIERYVATYTHQYDAGNYPEDLPMEALIVMAKEASNFYKFVEGGFTSEASETLSEVQLPWAQIGIGSYESTEALVTTLLNMYTPEDVKGVLAQYFTTDESAIDFPYYLKDGQIYYNTSLIEAEPTFRQPANQAGISWQRVTETELCLTFVYPVNVTDKDSNVQSTQIFEEHYTFYLTTYGWLLSPKTGQGPFVWSWEQDVWQDQAHTVTMDEVNHWVLTLDDLLIDYPKQEIVNDALYRHAHKMSYDHTFFEGYDPSYTTFDVWVFNGDHSLMNLEIGESMGQYKAADTEEAPLIYGVGPETYVVEHKLADGGLSYDERPYKTLLLDLENYLYNFILRRRAGVIALIVYDPQGYMKSAEYYYMDDEDKIIYISYDTDGVYRVHKDVIGENDYKE